MAIATQPSHNAAISTSSPGGPSSTAPQPSPRPKPLALLSKVRQRPWRPRKPPGEWSTAGPFLWPKDREMWLLKNNHINKPRVFFGWFLLASKKTDHAFVLCFFFHVFVVYLEETIFHWVYDGLDPRISSKMSIRRNHLLPFSITSLRPNQQSHRVPT